ncbi:stealth family protein [Glutamicibacter sp. MNS18]|uniref:stealth family protein n=1 Tax=Glutamicibacter sp. MNS18 TaxID=2989817 RepID=UPI00223643FE|nr:stealth family protein [Glutamicibacter sp. MNS18]MCW4466209.1 stealth family protein [Glutamicibacter sp. MNS18]
MKQLKAKELVEGALGKKAYRSLRTQGIKVERKVGKIRSSVVQRTANRGVDLDPELGIVRDGIVWTTVENCNLSEAIEANFRLLTESLDRAAIEWWLISMEPAHPPVIGVDRQNRAELIRVISNDFVAAPVYLNVRDGSVLLRHVSKVAKSNEFAEADILEFLEPRLVGSRQMPMARNSATQIEFWEIDETGGATAPRENRAAKVLSATDFERVTTTAGNFEVRTPKVLTKRMLDDVTFPIDAVYTWVDGDDPDWLASKRKFDPTVVGGGYHEEANHEARFRSRDELKYSLRSLEMYAPWFRKIFIVTAGQRPSWLATDHPQIEIIDHQDIYPEGEYLPTFNSNSIISRLHHIEGLSEHYVYINDDVFFGRPISKDKFFLGNGIAKVSTSNNRRPFGDPNVADEPHLNLTRNMRQIIDDEFGITISRAIKHTPHPQLKSVHFEMEEKFKEVYERTWASRFRHHEDIVADQLHHYYAQVIGRAVPTMLRYNYINILDDRYVGTMESTLRRRHRDTFCINDAPVEGARPIDDEFVTEFLESYFPSKSSFEK